ncbi:MAG: D-alanyl-D-alanine carboxypeptidase [Bacteroidota bacterium]|nr:D-alanyl-D-alanine carboxypeptidase [Bacteroidota bacterium]
MRTIILLLTCSLLFACTITKQIEKSAKENVLNDEALKTAHVGISIYEPASGKYWYNYQGDKYFVPASNTKLPTCYAAMKYLGDGLVGLRVQQRGSQLFVHGTGDPTFLHEDFKQQLVLDYLKTLANSNIFVWFGSNDVHPIPFWGSGWSWTDYESDYMAERSAFPVYGNVVWFAGQRDSIEVYPSYFTKWIVQKYSMPNGYVSEVKRELRTNEFRTFAYGKALRKNYVPFVTSDELSYELIADLLNHPENFITPNMPPPPPPPTSSEPYKTFVIHSQQTDSLLKPMMHRSDNFFAEQSLLMVSNERLGFMNDEKVIDTLLKTDFKDLPQKPRWVDGSGLSRYNLFSPQDFVFILNKMKNDFGMPRIKNILATGGEGTLGSYYKKDSTFIYAKTGTLSGVVAISGFLYTKKGKELIFSVLVNNHQGSATAVRRAVEKFIEGVREKF